jgi:uncharacterized protein YukE
MKYMLAGISLQQHSLKMEWEGVIGGITAEEFPTAFQQWYECCQKCISTSVTSISRKLKNKDPSFSSVELLKQFGLDFNSSRTFGTHHLRKRKENGCMRVNIG